MKVYIVSKGECEEGSTLLGVFSSKKTAEERVEQVIEESREKFTTFDNKIWWDSLEVDYIKIQEFTVQK